MDTRIPLVPASAFGVVLGLTGLGGAWRAAHAVWNLPGWIGEALMAAGILVWALVMVLYLLKWILAREEALAEWGHPILCCFVGLGGIATMLVAGAALPYSRPAAQCLFALGGAWAGLFGLWRTGALWKGGRDETATSPVLYLPLVGGGFVTATIAAALGYRDWAQFAFGAGLLTWFAVESLLLHRLYTAPEMPPALRPSLGIQFAPPTVGAVAYASVTTGPPDLWAHILIGYGLLQGLVLIRLLPWILKQPFTLSYWGFSFGIGSLATAPLRLVARGDGGAIGVLAPILFLFGNLAIAILVIATLRLAAAGRLLPPPPQGGEGGNRR